MGTETVPTARPFQDIPLCERPGQRIFTLSTIRPVFFHKKDQHLWISRLSAFGATRKPVSYTIHRTEFDPTSDKSAMTRWGDLKPEDNRDEHSVFRKENKMIFRLMIGKNPRSKGASRSGSDGQQSSGDWTNIGFKPKQNCASEDVENRKP